MSSRSYEPIIDYSGELPTLLSNVSIHRNFSKNNISFEFIYRLHLKCKKDHYGELCGIRCIGRDDEYGHTKCLANGTKVCLPGWEGRDCKSRKYINLCYS